MIKRESKKRRLDLMWVAVAVLALVFVGPALAQDEPVFEEPPLDEELLMPGIVEGTGTYFEVTDSEYLNITLQSSEPVNLRLESVPQMVVMDIEAAEGATSSQITVTGFAPSTTYYKYEDDYHNGVAFTTDGSGSYSYAQDLASPHFVFIQPLPGTMYIPPDSEDPQWWKDWWDGTTLTLQANVSGTIQIDTDGVTLDGAGHSVTGTGSGLGVYLNGRTGVTVKNLNVQQFRFGIYLYNSSVNTLTGNTASNNSEGIYLNNNSNDNTLTGNMASNNYCGIMLNKSSYNTLTGNTTNLNTYGIYILNSSYNTLTGNTCNSNNSSGIHLVAYNNILTGNTANSNDGHGISLWWVGSNTLTDNTAKWNNSCGIYIWRSSNNTLTGNNVLNNYCGIRVARETNRNSLTGNTASNNGNGIYLSWASHHTTVTGNTVNSNTGYGIWLSFSSYNRIYNNNFIDNSTQAHVTNSFGNVFNQPVPDGGNYWSDWTTPDADSDGFVDNPYVFEGGQDDLPWTRLDGWLVMLVEIDIKPGSYPNAINLGSHGMIPVAILSSADFDATNVDPETVELAGSGVAVRGKSNKYMAHQEDVNGDGRLDLIVQVATENLIPGNFQDGYAILTGETFDGELIQGEDEIRIVPPE